MNSRHVCFALFASSSLIAPTMGLGGSQIPLSNKQGPSSSLAFGLSLRAPGPETTLVKAPLRQSVPPAVWISTNFPTSPDYSTAAQFGSTIANLVWIDAHSTGNDVIPSLDPISGIPILTTNANWLGVVVSIRDGEVGQQGSLYNRASGPNRHSGADLFSYFFTESTGIAPSLPGSTLVSQTREMMGFDTATDEDIDALDFAIGVRGFSQVTPPTILFANPDEYYFSLTPLSASAINGVGGPAFATGAGGVPAPAHPAAIYKITWANGQWSAPVVYRSEVELNLTDNDDDIDGLAVDPASGVVAFSTQLVTGRSQLMVYHPLVGRFDLREGDGTLATVHLGGIDDATDIDSICILDPTEYEDDPSHFGVPVADNPIPVGGSAMGLSVTRSSRFTEIGPGTLHCQLSGRRGAPLARSNVIFFYSVNYDPSTGWAQANWTPLNTASPATMLRADDGSNFDNVFDFSLDAPHSDVPHTGAVCALAFDLSGAVIGSSMILQIGAP